jgi:hypothetical protein
MTACNYFLASSPRHLLLFAGLALESHADDENRLFFIEHVPAADVAAYLGAVRAWPASPFASTEPLAADYRSLVTSGKASKSRKAFKKAFRRQNRTLLDARLAEAVPDAVFVGVDNFYESQYLLHRSRQLNPGRRGIYVEDGVSVYDYSYRKTFVRTHPKEWLRAVRYFPWWRPSPLPGASSWLTEGHVAFPDLVLEPFRRKRLHALPRRRYLSAEFRDLASRIAESFGVDRSRLSDADVLIAVTHTKWGSLLPGYRETMRGICRSLLDAGKRVAIKPHPRDPNQDALGLDEHPNLYRVPGQAMFEALTVLTDNPDLVVVGDASTSLVAAKWLRPGAEVVALRHAPDGIDARYLQRVFDGIGVAIETDARALMRRCLDVAEPAAAAGLAGAA